MAKYWNRFGGQIPQCHMYNCNPKNLVFMSLWVRQLSEAKTIPIWDGSWILTFRTGPQIYLCNMIIVALPNIHLICFESMLIGYIPIKNFYILLVDWTFINMKYHSLPKVLLHSLKSTLSCTNIVILAFLVGISFSITSFPTILFLYT